LLLGAASEPDAPARNGVAASFLRLAEMLTFALDRLSRYENLLWRQARQIVFTLEHSLRLASIAGAAVDICRHLVAQSYPRKRINGLLTIFN
jgi:hypothetical protein